ncbi:Rdx family protein, partial [Acinetobacter baumannii]
EFGQEAEMVQADGGLFEVEDGGALLFSKQKEDRFPQPGEVVNVVKALAEGLPLDQARAKGQASIPKPPTFEEWFHKKVEGK